MELQNEDKFSDNFSKACLRIAGKRSQETNVPCWDEIEKFCNPIQLYQDELNKEAIQSMISFTPQKIAMFVMSNRDPATKVDGSICKEIEFLNPWNFNSRSTGF